MFPRCWRDRTDCEPIQAIDSAPDGLSNEQICELDYTPTSFVCCGIMAEGERPVPQDAYRLCWKNDAVDEMGCYDEQDLAHQAAVITTALAMISTRRVNGGTVEIPTMQRESTDAAPNEAV